jgi:uncharacterized protein with NAD-binding domain and iron-sulfur cluster
MTNAKGTKSDAKQKVAILGGGVGAMTAAFALTEQPGWQDRYEITLYQLGWRLGGKGASGRNPQRHDRIEEHGLHIWFGFYDNAFRVMQRAYAECEQFGLTPGSPFKSWSDAFKKHSIMTGMEHVDDAWLPWPIQFPTNDRVPGEGDRIDEPWDFVLGLIRFMLDRFDDLAEKSAKIAGLMKRRFRMIRWLLGWVRGRSAFRQAAKGRENEPHSLLHIAHWMAISLDSNPQRHRRLDERLILWLVKRFVRRVESLLGEEFQSNKEVRRIWILINLAASIMRGLILDDVIRKGFDCIDDKDTRQWLREHGAGELALDSPFLRGFYDLAFAYEDGDIGRPNFAAGVFMRSYLRVLFTYKGAVVYKMQAGMGDTVFSPIYEVLRHRGVKFRFFHKVTRLGLDESKRMVEVIDVDVQATTKGDSGYQPVKPINGVPSWPSVPFYDQLVEGEELKAKGINLESAWEEWSVEKRTLTRGNDFDIVVLGISLGALPFIAQDLIEADPRWRQMVDHVKTAQTQAFQVWLKKTADELGWHSPERAVVGAYVEPLDTWADMSDLLVRESWPGDWHVRNVSYFCGPMDCGPIPPFSEKGFPERETQRAKEKALWHLRTNMRFLWPQGTAPDNPDSVDWSILIDPENRRGEQRFDYHYWRANFEPTERYVLSTAGSTRCRLDGGDCGFQNLYLAGDWTRNGLNVGCVEAATISGLQAARAISGQATQISGEKDFRD